MAKRLFVLGAVFMLFAVVLAAPASAAKPLDVEFDLTTSFEPPPALSGGTFTASGTAVDEGLICGEGTKQDLVPEKWSPPPPKDPEDSKVTRNGQIITEFTCTEEPFVGDTFVIKAQMHLDISQVTWVVNWVMKDGTGGLAGLHGTGSGYGELIFVEPGPPIGADDVYRGHLH
jgi:hypothetical protein